MALNIVLVEPEIPQNTGTIARTCALTGARLHLIRPLGFSVEDKYLKRAGLDYWNLVEIKYYDSFFELLQAHPEANFYYGTTKAKKLYTQVEYREGDFLVFGKETQGLSQEILQDRDENMIKIPMRSDVARSLNLSNAVNIVVFEAFRQIGFPFFK